MPTGSEIEDELIAQAGALLGKTDRDEIVSAALKALIDREAARRLATLGGSMPGLEVPSRRRRS